MIPPGRRLAAAVREVVVLALAFACAALLAACDPSKRASPGSSPPEDARPARAFTDGLGREVMIRLPARRIVTLAPSNTEILFAIGAGRSVVGRDDYSDHPPEAARVPSIGLASGRLRRETILALEPDLVLAAEINASDHVKSIADLGLPVFLVRNPKSFEGLFENIALAGELTGRIEEARRLVASLQGRVRRVEERLASIGRRPTVFYELDSTDPSRPWTVGPGTFLDMLIRLAGGENLGARLEEPFPRISIETLIKADPEIIVLGDSAFGVGVETLSRRAGWAGLSAVRKGKIHLFDDDLGSRPGPRLVDGLETLARILHPGELPP